MLERQLATDEVALVRLLEDAGLAHERRSLRVPVRELRFRFEPEAIEIEFELPRGAFATAVLHELLADAWDVAERGED